MMRLPLLLLSFFFCFSGLLAQQTTLINNVEIFNGKDQKTFKANVLIIDNSINKISKNPIATDKSGNTQIIDGNGKFLMPGLIDAHYHTMFASLPQIVLLTSEWIITTVVGNKYIQSASILNVLIFYLILNYLLIPWGLYLQTNYNERIVINISMIVAIINIILNIVLFYKFGLIGIAYSTLITYLINVFLNIYFVYKSK